MSQASDECSVHFRCAAKINLFLHITGRLENGYHSLESIFRSVSLFDEITLTRRTDGKIVRSFGPESVAAEDDLTVRAARLLQAASGTAWGVDIQLIKRIPMGAGLGGGSSNAAGVLQHLNQLWGCKLKHTALHQLALGLGADVPFFLSGGDQFVQGIGEQLAPIALPHAHYVIIFPRVHCPTGPMFQSARLNRSSAPLAAEVLAAEELAQQDFLSDRFSNAFEALALEQHPEIAEAKRWLMQQAGNARLSGSGSALFAEVSEVCAQEIQARCPLRWQSWFVHSTAAS